MSQIERRKMPRKVADKYPERSYEEIKAASRTAAQRVSDATTSLVETLRAVGEEKKQVA